MGAVVEIWFESLIPFLLKDSHIVHWEQIQGTYIIYATTQTTDCLESYRSVQCEGRVQGVPKKTSLLNLPIVLGEYPFF